MADIEWPSTIHPRVERWTAITNTQTYRSPLSGAQHTSWRAGSRHIVELVMPPLMRAEADRLIGTLLRLQGQANRLLYRPRTAPTGSAIGLNLAGLSPTVPASGANSGATSVTIAGLNRALIPGDWLNVGNELKRVTEAVAAAASMAVPIWPEVHHTRTTVGVPKGRFLLMDHAMVEYEPGPLVRGMRVKLEESIT